MPVSFISRFMVPSWGGEGAAGRGGSGRREEHRGQAPGRLLRRAPRGAPKRCTTRLSTGRQAPAACPSRSAPYH
jgi:hypothetical protein